MKKILGLLCAMSISIFSSRACTCVEIHTSLQKKVKTAFRDADLIFTGLVIDIEKVQTAKPYSSSLDPVIYTFRIINNIKGTTTSEIVKVSSARSGASCGYMFQLDYAYLVYSYNSDQDEHNKDLGVSFDTSLCSRNQRLTNSLKKELKILQSF